MQQYFFDLADKLIGQLTGGEVLLAGYSGEDSDFVRFNQSKIRQATNVRQRYITLDLIDGRRRAVGTVGLSGEKTTDSGRAGELLANLRSQLPHVPEDPYLLYSTDVCSSSQVRDNLLPPREQAVSAVLEAGKGRDLVGIYSAGGIFNGFANSLGQRNWFATHSFCADWSFYHVADKAVKTTYAGFKWDAAAFARKVQMAADKLAILARPAKSIQPGTYRVYFTPTALGDIIGLLYRGGFGIKSHRTNFTPLLKMIVEGAALSPAVTLLENTADGIAPNFEADGFIKPDVVTMIEHGRHRDCLVCARSAKEYGLACNGANAAEAPVSADLAAGDLPGEEVLARLDTGVYISGVWYLNYSDRPGGRITGMTRFATLWVEGGKIVAPLNVMRFDETIYRALGENLLGLTRERDFIPSAGTTGGRSTGSTRVPGALIKDFTFTL